MTHALLPKSERSNATKKIRSRIYRVIKARHKYALAVAQHPHHAHYKDADPWPEAVRSKILGGSL